ncbi:hypothetical protein GCM10009030_39970 [Haloarcula pellucida]|uniref:Uncharacterized protein n=1 Tax=Haloarcula pellucida TaxID=1427151 RepID=A0A830GQI2_9EURY|nr:hypothetical protein GCM10009030_39970 [Halomicroarcula pellucida]
MPTGDQTRIYNDLFGTQRETLSLGSWGSTVTRLKLKGIDGRAPPGVEPAA